MAPYSVRTSYVCADGQLIRIGLCKIRIITMALRTSWAYYPQNIGLAIAANIFVYVGTIILYGVNWFFVQRIIRAQHADRGWSTAYRIFHRAALACLGVALLLLIVSQVWRNFTLDDRKLKAFRVLLLTGQTYFTIFCIAPAALIAIALLIPHTEVEKFGAGRLRNKISILLAAVAILSIGQVFRCVLNWIPQTSLVDIQSGAVELPVYLSKACFYSFNFVTEILVIAMFAIFRVDLRFHVPNGSRRSGDYSSSRLDVYQDEKNKRISPTIIEADESTSETIPKDQQVNAAGTLTAPMAHQNNSSQTLHRYQSSVFEDTQTLAESLRYPSTTLGVDPKTGNWKVKRLSQHTTSSRTSISYAPSSSRTTLADRNTLAGVIVPPVPEVPAQWPLPDAAPPPGSSAIREHPTPSSRQASRILDCDTASRQTYNAGDTVGLATGDAVEDTLEKLEYYSGSNRGR